MLRAYETRTAVQTEYDGLEDLHTTTVEKLAANTTDTSAGS
jgi:hypothetical protein